MFSAFVRRRCSRSFQGAGSISFDNVNHDSVLLNIYGRRTVSPAFANFCSLVGGTATPLPELDLILEWGYE
jgi:hypothetical protein